MENNAVKLELTVIGEPPIKRGPGGVSQIRERRRQQRSQSAEVLRQAVEGGLKEMGLEHGRQFPWNPMTARIHLEVRLARGKCKADAANIIGGIADELQDVLYANDDQVCQIRYQETLAEDGQDQYELTIYEVAG